jgi:hypothetical protein
MNSSLHPHGNGGTAEPVQAKSFINSMLQLIQWQWGRGRCLNKISDGFDLLYIHKTTANPSDLEHEITVDYKQENTVANDLVM